MHSSPYMRADTHLRSPAVGRILCKTRFIRASLSLDIYSQMAKTQESHFELTRRTKREYTVCVYTQEWEWVSGEAEQSSKKEERERADEKLREREREIRGERVKGAQFFFGAPRAHRRKGRWLKCCAQAMCTYAREMLVRASARERPMCVLYVAPHVYRVFYYIYSCGGARFDVSDTYNYIHMLLYLLLWFPSWRVFNFQL